MGDLAYFRVQEIVELDKKKLGKLRREPAGLRPAQGVKPVLQEIEVRVGCISHAVEQGEIDVIRKSTRGLVGLAQRAGLTSLARATHNFEVALRQDDFHAIAATVARLQRVGELSMMALSISQNRSV